MRKRTNRKTSTLPLDWLRLSPDALVKFIFFILLACLALISTHSANAKPVETTVRPPVFSHTSGFYNSEVNLTLAAQQDGVKIYYTLDGSIPDPMNLNGTRYTYKNQYQQPSNAVVMLEREFKTHAYNGPIKITNRTFEPDQIAYISTTFDEQPKYFPAPIKHSSQNSLTNLAIGGVNWLIGVTNNVLNYMSHQWYKIKTGKTKIKKYKHYINFLDYSDFIYEHSPKGLVVRAISVNEQGSKSAVATQTIMVENRDNFHLPSVFLTAQEDELFSYENGILVAGKTHDNWLKDQPRPIKITCGTPANWNWRSDKTDKRLAHLSVIDSQQEAANSTDAHIRVHGGCSRNRSRNKSIRLYPDDYTVYSKLFREPTGNVRVNLRNAAAGGGGISYIKDPLLQRISEGLAFATQQTQPVNLFLNGEYYGLYYATERKDDRYIADKFNLKKKNIDLLKREGLVDSGTSDNYDELSRWLNETNSSDLGFYSAIESKLDIDSFIDYYSTEIFLANNDWPENNIAFWRHNGKTNNANPTADGRWRWIMYDMDCSLGGCFSESSHEYNGLLNASGQLLSKKDRAEWSIFLFNKLLQVPEIQTRFIVRFADLLNTTFSSSRTLQLATDLAQEITPDLPKHIRRWQEPDSLETWQAGFNSILQFLENRPTAQRKQLIDFFDLAGTYTLHVSTNGKDAGTIKVNTLHLGVQDDQLKKPIAASSTPRQMEAVLALPWVGEYFQALPLRLEALPEPEYQFSHWKVTGVPLTPVQQHNPVLNLAPSTALTVEAIFIKSDT